MKRLLCCLLLAVPCAVEAQSQDDTRFVRVPYSKAFDEIVFLEALAGRQQLPKNLELKAGGIWQVRPVDTPAGKKKLKYVLDPRPEYRPTKSLAFDYFESSPLNMFALHCEVAEHYDNEGRYYVSEAVYEKYKARYIHRHKGRVEGFQTPEARKRMEDDAKAGKGIVFRTNPLDFEWYVWDATDRVWRYPVTLGRVGKDWKRLDGELLSKTRVPSDNDFVDVLDAVLARHNKKMEEARKVQKENKK